MAYIVITIALWVFLTKLVPFKDWRYYYPTIIFSGLIAIVSDLLGIVYNQWVYYGPVVGGLSLWSVIGIASAEGGLFVRIYPKPMNSFIKISYWMGWSLINTLAERFFVWASLIGYLHWNSIRAFLFYLFFFGAVWLQEYWYNGTGRLR